MSADSQESPKSEPSLAGFPGFYRDGVELTDTGSKQGYRSHGHQLQHGSVLTVNMEQFCQQ